MPKPRIALILNEPPLPRLGAATRSYHAMIKELAQRGTDLHVFATGVADDDTREALRTAYPNFHDRIRLFPPGHPVRLVDKLRNAARPMAFMTGAALERTIRQQLRAGEFDLVHVEHAWTARALPRSLKNVPKLLGLHYFLKTDFGASPPAKSLRERIARNRILGAEAALVRRFDHVRVLSAEMAETLAGIHPGAKAHVVPLPIDPADYRFVPPAEDVDREPVVTMIGSMYWPPSLSAAERLVTRLWPRIRERVPAAKLEIVGRDAFRHFGASQGQNGISVYENVPEIEPFFRRATVLAYAPPAGSGTKVKIQEAMLLGLPVVTNRCGAEGIEPVHGEHALLGDTDDEIVAAAVSVLTDPSLRQMLAVNARRLIERRCGPSAVVNSLSETYAQAIASHERQGPR
jgi:glycosyltransferase involved in cell wall biosynthesis